MHEISTANGGSTNIYQNQALHKQYDRHLSKIQEIENEKIRVRQMLREQEKISAILKKSKEVSRNFRDKEFNLKRW